MIYTQAGLDRLVERRADADYVRTLLTEPGTRLYPLWRGQNLIDESGPRPAWLPVSEAAPLLGQAELVILLGEQGGIAHFAIDLSHLDDPAGGAVLADRGVFRNLRDVGPEMNQADGARLAFARGVAAWHESHGYCPRCGGPSEPADAGHKRRCTACGRSQYPRVDPAVIMLASRDDRVLLAHNRRRPSRYFSCVAGYVEIGESLEEAVAREVKEEVGLDVLGVRYFASQPWPFPSSLMLGFFAEAGPGEPVPDGDEIVETVWLTADDLRRVDSLGIHLPLPDSMARRLIARWIEEHG